MNVNLEIPVQYAKGVGPRFSESLKRLDILTIRDLLYHFPRTYEDRRSLPTISQLKSDGPVTFLADIATIQVRTTPKTVIQVRLADESGSIEGVWFNQPYLQKVFHPGMRLVVSGKIVFNEYTHHRQLWVSDHEIIVTPEDFKLCVGCIVPIYPLVAGISGIKMRKMIASSLEYLEKIVDPIPPILQFHYQLMPLQKAIHRLHFPQDGQLHLARNRVVFDEFLHMQMPMIFRRIHTQKVSIGPQLKTEGPLIETHLNNLPYTLTNAQKSVIEDIKKDVTSGRAMNRMIQGDVGSGKTDVALMSLLFAIQSGHKAAIMAPLEILATQHYLKFLPIFEKLNIPVLLLKSKISKAQREKIAEAIKSPEPMVLVGTHALLEDDVVIENLGILVVDEQHRFGVLQRTKLRDKGQSPHCLFLTATPIPRSLMLTCYGDLDKSIIDEMPPGRVPCKTACITPSKQYQADNFCRQHLQQGRQVFVVLPLIEESQKIDLKAAIQEHERIQTVFPEFKSALLHGKLSNKEKESIMAEFKRGETHILVATTVIEVGVDVPNATVMVIHDAGRFGLSQLHQLRGRVRRCHLQSYCLLIASPKTPEAKRRIQAMLNTTDGFKIAQEDLAIRGPGDLLGFRQSGLPSLQIADLIQDEKILLLAREAATRIISSDPNLAHPDHYQLKIAMIKTYGHFLQKRLN